MQLYAQLIVQVAESPKVVVAYEEMDGYACIGELGQFALQSDKTFGNNSLVFKPKVEHVAHYVKFLAFVTYRVEQTQQLEFALVAVFQRRYPQMEI